MSDASQKLKSLQTALKAAICAQDLKKSATVQARHDELAATQHVDRLRADIQKLYDAEKDFVFTEHVFVRYFERVLGYNLEDIKAQILPPADRDRLRGRPYAEYRVGDTHAIVIRNGTVITVNPQPKKPRRPRLVVDDELSEGDAFEVDVGYEHEEGESLAMPTSE